MQQINVSTSLPLFFERPELEDDNINNNYGINNNMMHRDVYSPPLTSEQLAVFYHRQTSQAQPSMFGLDNAAAVGSINRKLEQLINAVKRNSKLALYFIGRLIVRIGPMYGEDDRHSLVCD